MPTQEEIMQLIYAFLQEWIHTIDDVWVALYRLFIDYIYQVPRITDSNRLKAGIWRERAKQLEQELAKRLQCSPSLLPNYVDAFMQRAYQPGTQRMNPIGIGFACAIVCLIQRFGKGSYTFKLEAKIGVDVFPNLTGFRRKSVDIVAFKGSVPFAVISSKWGIRHDRLRDPQEEADTYKKEVPALKFFVVTNEFDNARLQKLLTYPTIDGVFHTCRDRVWELYGPSRKELTTLKDVTELFPIFD